MNGLVKGTQINCTRRSVEYHRDVNAFIFYGYVKMFCSIFIPRMGNVTKAFCLRTRIFVPGVKYEIVKK